jgi:hypothetical protein
MAPLTACVAMDYGPIGDDRPYGFAETKRADGSYILRVVHPSFNDAVKFWDQRAAEICGSSDYTKNIYTAIMPTTTYSSYGGRPGAPHLEGLLTCASSTTTTAPAASPQG